jgi:hypothetical protein
VIVFTVIGILTTVIVGGFFLIIGYGEFMYSRRWKIREFICKNFGHRVFDRKGVMHDYCLRCRK